MKILILTTLFLFLSCSSSWGTDITADSCSQAHVQAAIDNVATVAGDTVTIPPETCTWGVSASQLSVDKDITLTGAGQGQTIITLSDTGGTFGNGVIVVSDGGTVKSMTINGSDVQGAVAFSCGTADGWRITDIDYNGGNIAGYFMYASTYGLVDNNDIEGDHGSAELIYMRGPTDSWQTVSSIGGADNVFIENNTFGGTGYVSDANSNARMVVRYNTITGRMKVDGHGLASNTPAQGVRHMEIYNNHWTDVTTGGSWNAIEFRGGTGRIFNNDIDSTTSTGLGAIALRDYCFTSNGYPNCESYPNYPCYPADYPIKNQVGRGYLTAEDDLDPAYIWNNTKPVYDFSDLYASGAQTYCSDPTLQMKTFIEEDRDYYESATKPAAMDSYTIYTCPHPLAGSGSCDSEVAGVDGYVLASDLPPLYVDELGNPLL